MQRRIPLSSLLNTLITLGTAAMLASCQRYTPEDLNLEKHKEIWKGYSVNSQKVSDFAKKIDLTQPKKNLAYDASDGISLPEAELIALLYNSDLRATRLRVGLAQTRINDAGRWDDPELAFDLMKVVESVPEPWITGGSLSITIPISGRLKAQKDQAAAELTVALDRVSEAEWNVRNELRKAWLAWSLLKLQQRETESLISTLDSVISATSQLSEIGEIPKTEAALFTIERASRELELEDHRAKISEHEQQLRSLMGLSPEAPVQFLPMLNYQGGSNATTVPEQSNPTLLRLRSEYLLSEKTLKTEIQKQYPDLTFGPQGGKEEGNSRIGLVGGIPLPILNSNRGNISQARGRRDLARLSFEREYEQIIGRLAALAEKEKGLLNRRDRLNKTLIPLVDAQITNARKLLEIGEGNSLVLLESLVRSHEAKLHFLSLQTNLSTNRVEIQHLQGPLLSF